jgi:hypothetical protein
MIEQIVVCRSVYAHAIVGRGVCPRRPASEIEPLVFMSGKSFKKSCHSERSEAESKNLRISFSFSIKSAPRFLDSLRSLGMTGLAVVFQTQNNQQS